MPLLGHQPKMISMLTMITKIFNILENWLKKTNNLSIKIEIQRLDMVLEISYHHIKTFYGWDLSVSICKLWLWGAKVHICCHIIESCVIIQNSLLGPSIAQIFGGTWTVGKQHLHLKTSGSITSFKNVFVNIFYNYVCVTFKMNGAKVYNFCDVSISYLLTS